MIILKMTLLVRGRYKMVMVTKEGYIGRRSSGCTGRVQIGDNLRDWWLVKHVHRGQGGQVYLGNSIYLPSQYVGKRVRFRVEIVETKGEEMKEKFDRWVIESWVDKESGTASICPLDEDGLVLSGLFVVINVKTDKSYNIVGEVK